MYQVVSSFAGQGNGTVSLPLKVPSFAVRGYLLQFTVRDAAGDPAAPAAGTAQIAGRTTPGAPLEDIGSAVALSTRANWVHKLDGYAFEGMQVVIASLTAAHTVDCVVVALP